MCEDGREEQAKEVLAAVSRAGGTVVEEKETPEQTALREYAKENGHVVAEETWRVGGKGVFEVAYAAFGCKEHCGALFFMSKGGKARKI